METGYKTRQRQAILDYMAKNADVHLSVDDIFEALRNAGESVGKTTVYRHVERLAQSGNVRKYRLDGCTCYQYQMGKNCNEHFHLKCSQCGKLYHLDCSFMSDLDTHIFEHHGFRMDNTKTVIYGICKGCIS